MSDYNEIFDTAVETIWNRLNIPDDIYLSWDSNTYRDFLNQYHNLELIYALVDTELANADTSELSPYELEDLREMISDEILDHFDELDRNYTALHDKLIEDAYFSLVQLLNNSDIENVVNVDVDYEPADYSVGQYESRTITLTLSDGQMITMEVSFEE